MEPSTPELQSILCDIVILPSNEQARIAIEASEVLSAQGSLNTLDDVNFYAHASLYMFQMGINNQDDCISALKQIASESCVQQPTQCGYKYVDSGINKGYVGIAYERNAKIDHLQEVVVGKFNNLRTGSQEGFEQEMKDEARLKLENLQNLGYAAIGELF